MKQVWTIGGAWMLALVCLGSAAFAEARGQDWATFLGPEGRGVTSESGFVREWGRGGPPIAWRKDIGVGFASMAAVGDRVYAVGNVDGDYEVLHCLDAATGEAVWQQRFPSELVDKLHEGGAGSTPVVHDGAVYVVSRVGEVRRFDAETGEPAWTLDLMQAAGLEELPEWGFTSSVAVAEGLGYVQAGATVAIDLEQGDVVWVSEPYAPAYTTPQPFTHDGNHLVATLNSYGLVVINTSDGSEVAAGEWETRFDASAPSPLVLDDGRIFISTGYQAGSVLFRLTGESQLERVYENRHLATHMDTAVLEDGHIYGFDGNHNRPQIVDLVCLDVDTGEEKWRHNDYGCGTVIMADGTLVILSDDGILALAEATPDGFRELSRARILDGRCWAAPVLAHGRLFARDAAGNMVCVDLRPTQ